ncbi:MAG: hypothetical protein LAN83_02145 [Acidobacteriia bacterium]|nr:hypothetical protein [Terriglobia bacterium]
MKTTVLVLCFLCATAALGQTAAGGSSLSAQPVVYAFSSHPRRASERAMAQEQSLLHKPGLVYAQGERPLWEVMPEKQEIPLGDVARVLRKEHATAKKANRVVEN